MCVAQVGQVAPSAWRTVLAPCRTLLDAEAELCLCCGHVRVMGLFELRPQAAAWKGCATARGQESCWVVKNGISNTKTAFLDGGLSPVPNTFSIGYLDDSPEATF